MSDENSIPTHDPVTGKKRSAREMMALREAAKEASPPAAPASPPAPGPATVGSASSRPTEPGAQPGAAVPPVAPDIKVPGHDPVTGKKLSAREKMALREKMLAETAGADVQPAETTVPPATPAPHAPAAHAPAAAPPKPAFPPFPEEPPAELSPEQSAEADAFRERLGDAVLATGLSGNALRLTISPDRIVDAASLALERGYNCPTDVVATDLIGSGVIRVSYILSRIPYEGRDLFLHVNLPRDDPRVPSVGEVYQGAVWPEREAYDLVGVVFEGHPLRKDYTFID